MFLSGSCIPLKVSLKVIKTIFLSHYRVLRVSLHVLSRRFYENLKFLQIDPLEKD